MTPDAIRRPLAFLLLTLTPLLASAAPQEPEIAHIEPVGDLYTQIVAVEHHGVTTLNVSGQVGRGETLEEQSRALYQSMRERLAKAGAKPADVVKLVTYVVDWNHDKADAAFAGFYETFQGRTPAHTLVGVQALYSPHALIEVEAVAVVRGD